jgi:hypothetical protein
VGGVFNKTVVNTQIKKTSFITHTHPIISPPANPSLSSPPLKIHKLTHAKIVEFQLKGLYYNFGEKYFFRHKYNEKKIFMAILEEFSDDEVEAIPQDSLPPPIEYIPLYDSQDVEPQISLHTFTRILAPQTLKLIGYIKHRKIIILIEICSTHNFIHRWVS